MFKSAFQPGENSKRRTRDACTRSIWDDIKWKLAEIDERNRLRVTRLRPRKRNPTGI